RGGRDPAGQRAGHALNEEARCVSGKMPEQVAAQIPRHPDKSGAGDPAGKSPEQIVCRNQRGQEKKPRPDCAGMARNTCAQQVDQDLDAILRRNRAGHGGYNGTHDDRMGYGPRPDVMKNKCQWPVGIPTQVSHAVCSSPVGCRCTTELQTPGAAFGFHWNFGCVLLLSLGWVRPPCSQEKASMRIAQIAPLTESVPPKLYGGSQRGPSSLTAA